MKYCLLNIFGIVITVLGIATTAQADLSIHRSHSESNRGRTSTPPAVIIFTNVQSKVIGFRRSIPVASHSPLTSSTTPNSLEMGVYHQINRYRQSLNLPPLAIDPVISAQARAHSEQMARTGNLIHRVEPFAQQVAYPSAAENVATSRGYRYPDLVAVRGWIASPRHQHHTIGPYNRTGIGVAQNAKGEYYFTQIFVYKR